MTPRMAIRDILLFPYYIALLKNCYSYERNYVRCYGSIAIERAIEKKFCNKLSRVITFSRFITVPYKNTLEPCAITRGYPKRKP